MLTSGVKGKTFVPKHHLIKDTHNTPKSKQSHVARKTKTTDSLILSEDMTHCHLPMQQLCHLVLLSTLSKFKKDPKKLPEGSSQTQWGDLPGWRQAVPATCAWRIADTTS